MNRDEQRIQSGLALLREIEAEIERAKNGGGRAILLVPGIQKAVLGHLELARERLTNQLTDLGVKF